MFSIHLNLSGTYVTSYVLDTFELAAGGKPSTWFPPGGLVEQILASQQRGLLRVMFSIHLNLSGTYVMSYVLDTFECMRNICFFMVTNTNKMISLSNGSNLSLSQRL